MLVVTFPNDDAALEWYKVRTKGGCLGLYERKNNHRSANYLLHGLPESLFLIQEIWFLSVF